MIFEKRRRQQIREDLEAVVKNVFEKQNQKQNQEERKNQGQGQKNKRDQKRGRKNIQNQKRNQKKRQDQKNKQDQNRIACQMMIKNMRILSSMRRHGQKLSAAGMPRKQAVC